MAVNAVTSFEVTQGLYWVLSLHNTGLFRPLQVKRHTHCIAFSNQKYSAVKDF
jgi:hypothetical protein